MFGLGNCCSKNLPLKSTAQVLVTTAHLEDVVPAFRGSEREGLSASPLLLHSPKQRFLAWSFHSICQRTFTKIHPQLLRLSCKKVWDVCTLHNLPPGKWGKLTVKNHSSWASCWLIRVVIGRSKVGPKGGRWTEWVSREIFQIGGLDYPLS